MLRLFGLLVALVSLKTLKVIVNVLGATWKVLLPVLLICLGGSLFIGLFFGLFGMAFGVIGLLIRIFFKVLPLLAIVMIIRMLCSRTENPNA